MAQNDDTTDIDSILEQLNRLVADKKELDVSAGDDEQSFSERAIRLHKAYESFSRVESLAPGDIVVWKDRMRNKSIPSYAQPAIVVEVLSQPLFDEENGPSSVYFREPLDVRLAVLDKDGDFVSFLFDSRRFKRVGINEL